MRVPVKLNKEFWYWFLTKLFPSTNDPRVLFSEIKDNKIFTKAVSVFKFGTTFKTTQYCRFPLTINALKELNFFKPPVILDIGASDGSTSIHLIENFDFEKIYVTDLNTEVYYKTNDSVTYFYNSSYDCILIATNYLIIYSDYKDAVFPLNIIANHYFSKAFTADKTFKKIDLFNPSLKRAKRDGVALAKYNLFNEWRHEKVDLIIAANVLNRNYFSKDQITKAIKIMVATLKETGRVVIIDNRKIEKSTVFSFVKGQISVEVEINGGTEIRDFVLSVHRA